MSKGRNVLIVIGMLLFAISFLLMDFSDLSWSANSGNYIGMFSMLCLIMGMISSNIYGKKHKKQD